MTVVMRAQSLLSVAPCVLLAFCLACASEKSRDDDDTSGSSSSSNSSGTESSGNGGGNCPDASGTWTISTHCESELIGSMTTITQNGCSFTEQAFGFSGTINDDGSFTATGNPGGGELTCTGSVEGNSMSQTCEPGGCFVVLTK